MSDQTNDHCGDAMTPLGTRSEGLLSQQREELYREIFEDSPVAIWVEDWSRVKAMINRLERRGVKDWRCYFERHPDQLIKAVDLCEVIDFSAATLSVYGATRKEDVLKSSTGAEYTAGELKSFCDQIVAVAGGAIRFVINAAETTMDGSEIFTRVHGVIPQEHRENWSRVIFTIEDFTERKRAREALCESEQRFKDFGEAASDWFWELDQDLRLTYLSDYPLEFGGSKPEDLLGKTWQEADRGYEDNANWRRHLACLKARRAFRDFQYPCVIPNGSIRHFSASGIPVFDQAGHFKGYRGIGTDITEHERAKEALIASERALQERIAELEETQRRLEDKERSLISLAGNLKIARDEAEAANRTKSEFLAAMSHELRTPLNAVIGFSEMIKDERLGPVGSPQYRGYASDIYGAGRHLLALINDILDLSKVESGVEELHDDSIEVPEFVQSVMRLVRQRAENSSVKLQLDTRNDLPLLLADERKLKQILVNLLDNAVKFTNAEGQVTLKAWCRPGSGFIFQVSDTGVGITPEDIPRALSQFGQVESYLNRNHDGTGLGLPLSKSLTELHGGSLDLQSQLGVGTTVTVRLPAARIVSPAGDAGWSAEDGRAAS